ncbi:aminoglycoside 3'-phosphotransferase [Kribbella sp. NPDC026596]|uniref:aminoglycoside 3'-phosphotransferase n=1 Tax=Kribbella sp. NPDC026596 TaxID=3155122 RepID=UPI0033D3F443
MLISGRPPDDVAVPGQIRRLGRDQSVVPVWRNGLGGLTFQIGSGPSRRFAKWAPAGSGLDLTAEVLRLQWATEFASVPVLLDHGTDSEGAWMVTAGLPGDSAVSDRWKADPATAVQAAGVGLRRLHDALPVEGCPFTWSVDDRIGQSMAVRGGAISDLPAAPPIGKLVVCHGDACVPNTLVTPDGQYSGQVDLANLGTADCWADLAVATWSTEWNYGPGWEETLLSAYGVQPDQARTEYYRLLWTLDTTPPPS